MQDAVLTDTDYGVILTGYPWESAEHKIQEELDNPEVNWSSSYNTAQEAERRKIPILSLCRVATFILGTLKRKTILCCGKLQHYE